jgi:2'-5' RNA ligase
MRLFVAIDLDEEAREAIGAEQRRLAQAFGPDCTLKWTRPADMHLTLAFLGEIDQSRGAVVVEALRADVAAAPFIIAFARLGIFPPHGAPSVLWLGVGAGGREVIAVQRVIADRLERAGVTLEHRRYHPHLTLARWRRARGADRERVMAADRETEVARVSVGSVTLYQSHLSSAGPSYTALARARLES